MAWFCQRNRASGFPRQFLTPPSLRLSPPSLISLLKRNVILRRQKRITNEKHEPLYQILLRASLMRLLHFAGVCPASQTKGSHSVRVKRPKRSRLLERDLIQNGFACNL